MDQVFSSQFRAMQAAFLRRGISIEIAYTPAGEAAYLYQVGRLLATREIAPEVVHLLPGAYEEDKEASGFGSLVVINIEHLADGYRTVPEALDYVDEHLHATERVLASGASSVTPVHVMHVTSGIGPEVVSGRLCQFGEPGLPNPGPGSQPYPPVESKHDDGTGVLIGICDTGLLASHASASWLAGPGVTGEDDPLGQPLAGGLHAIPRYCGHGTFVAGVARCEAPGSDIYVSNPFMDGGGLLETTMFTKVEQLLGHDPRPGIVSLSAGGYTRNDWAPLTGTAFGQSHGGVTLVASADNSATSRPFWPAAFGWAVSVGALAPGLAGLAHFTNYGPWVDIYAPGTNLVNAFATGVYTYQEPPSTGHQATFHGMAVWSGTSFAAPFVAGRIATEMTRSGLSASDAWANLRQNAPSLTVTYPYSGTVRVLHPLS